jgi:hypothetical protein
MPCFQPPFWLHRCDDDESKVSLALNDALTLNGTVAFSSGHDLLDSSPSYSISDVRRADN